MDDIANVNSAQYVLASLSNTSASVTVEPRYYGLTRLIVDNTEGTVAAFVTAGITQPTAVFPTSATAALDGSVVPAGKCYSFSISPNARFVSAIRASASAANLYIALSTGA